MKKTFQLSAITVAIALSTSAYANINIASDNGDVSVTVNDDNGSQGDFVVYNGVGSSQIETLRSNRSQTEISTDGGNSLTVNNSGVTTNTGITAAGTVSGNNVSATSNVTAGGNISTATGTVSGANVTATGTVSGNAVNANTGSITTLNSNTVNSNVVNANTGNITTVNSTNVNATNNVTAGNNVAATNNVTAGGNISTVTGTVSGATVTDNVATLNQGNLTGLKSLDLANTVNPSATETQTIAVKANTNDGFDVNHAKDNVLNSTPVQVGDNLTIPTVDTANAGVSVTKAYTETQTRTQDIESNTQVITSDKIEFTSQLNKVDQERTINKTTDVQYDASGNYTGSGNVQTVNDTGFVATVGGTQLINEESIILGKENTGDDNALTIRKTDANGTQETQVTATGITTGSITADNITLNGADLATVISDGDAATLASANTYTDNTATTLRAEAAAETTRVNQAIVDGDAATLASANTYTDNTATTLRGEAAVETTRVNQAIATGDAATLASANTYTDNTATTLRGEAAAETTRVNQAIATGDAATLASANTYTNTTATTLRSEITTANNTTLASAKSYTDTQVSRVSQKLDDVEKTAYRGVAIALAAQQQVPNIQPGQVAVFGGVGHYEGETAGALGIVGSINERTSISAAIGVAGGSEVGGRVGVAYVFGGN